MSRHTPTTNATDCPMSARPCVAASTPYAHASGRHGQTAKSICGVLLGALLAASSIPCIDCGEVLLSDLHHLSTIKLAGIATRRSK